MSRRSLDFIRAYYEVPAVIGGRVRINGRFGTITGGPKGWTMK